MAATTLACAWFGARSLARSGMEHRGHSLAYTPFPSRRDRTHSRQKVCPHGVVAGCASTSPQISQRAVSTSARTDSSPVSSSSKSSIAAASAIAAATDARCRRRAILARPGDGPSRPCATL